MVNREILIRRMTLLEEYLRDIEEVKEQTTFAKFTTDKVIQRWNFVGFIVQRYFT